MVVIRVHLHTVGAVEVALAAVPHRDTTIGQLRVVVDLRFVFLARQQISRQLLAAAAAVGKEMAVAVVVQQEEMQLAAAKEELKALVVRPQVQLPMGLPIWVVMAITKAVVAVVVILAVVAEIQLPVVVVAPVMFRC